MYIRTKIINAYNKKISWWWLVFSKSLKMTSVGLVFLIRVVLKGYLNLRIRKKCNLFAYSYIYPMYIYLKIFYVNLNLNRQIDSEI